MANVSMLVPAGVATVYDVAGTSYTPDTNGLVSVPASSVPSLLAGGCVISRVLYKNTTAAAGTTGTAEQTLMTYSLPANTLSENGMGLRIRCWGTSAANTNNKTGKLYFGSEVVVTATMAGSGELWYLELEVFRTGLSAQVVFGKGIYLVTNATLINTTGTETETSAIVIKCTGTGGTSGADITCSMMLVEQII